MADQLAARVAPRGLSQFVQFYLPLLAYETVMGVPERMAVVGCYYCFLNRGLIRSMVKLSTEPEAWVSVIGLQGLIRCIRISVILFSRRVTDSTMVCLGSMVC